MSKHYDNIEYDDKESNIQNTWKKTYSTEESKQEDYDRNNHSISLSEIKEQETLEEVALKLYPENIESIMDGYHDSNSYQRESFIKGYKLAQKRMYSDIELFTEELKDKIDLFEYSVNQNSYISDYVNEWFRKI
jgi:hypothetical protein